MIFYLLKYYQQAKMTEKTESEINKWRDTLKSEAEENNVTTTMYKHDIAYTSIKDIFDTLNNGSKISKKKLFESLPYNMMLLSKAKTEVRKNLPEQIGLGDFIELCKCIKSPQDYTNLYLFELMDYPKDEYNFFKLGAEYTYKFGSEQLEIVLPINILKGALKLHYDIFTVNNYEFLKENSGYIQYEIESKTNSMRFDLVFSINTGDKTLRYVKEYHERYHTSNQDRIFADKMEESYLKLNGTALTVFDFGDDFKKSAKANAIDIQFTIKMLLNALMFVPELRYKYLLQLFEKDLNRRVNNLGKQVSKVNSNVSYYDMLLKTYEKKKEIQTEFASNKSIEKMFVIKEQCYNSEQLHIVKIDQLIDMFMIDTESESDKLAFARYLFGLGFNTKSYAWHQISEMISCYNNSEKIKNVLDEYYRYLEKNYIIVIRMKDAFMKAAYPDGSKDYNLYVPFMVNKITDAKDKIINETKKLLDKKDKQLEVLTDIIKDLEIRNKELNEIYDAIFDSDNAIKIINNSDNKTKTIYDENTANDIPALDVQSDSDDTNSCDDEFELNN